MLMRVSPLEPVISDWRVESLECGRAWVIARRERTRMDLQNMVVVVFYIEVLRYIYVYRVGGEL